MKLKLVLEISVTLLLARLKQSVIAAAGVAFGIGTFICLVSLMTGFNKLLDDLILNRTPHVLLYNEIKASSRQPAELAEELKGYTHFIHSVKPRDAEFEIKNSLAIIRTLEKDPVVTGIAPRVTAQVFYRAGDIDINGIVFGIDVAEEDRLFNFRDYIIKGNHRELETVENSIVLGKGVADKLLLDIGDNIEVISAEGKKLSLKVAGIFQLGVADIDAVQSYTALETAQRIMGKTSSYITEIQLKLTDLNLAPVQAKKYRKVFYTDTRDIITSNTQFETGSSIRNIITYSVSITLLVVAGFGIYNILNMTIYEKMDSIAIMKATGFSGKTVRRIFLFLSLIIGITGGIAGLIIGITGSLLIDQIPFETTSMPAIKTFPIIYNPYFYFTGIFFAIFTTYGAGFFPARRAGKVDPVVIIRGK
jgi:lipoprotein-releasing system permease protein